MITQKSLEVKLTKPSQAQKGKYYVITLICVSGRSRLYKVEGREMST